MRDDNDSTDMREEEKEEGGSVTMTTILGWNSKLGFLPKGRVDMIDI